MHCINGYYLTSFFRLWGIAVEVLLLVSIYSIAYEYIHLGLLEGTFCVVPAHKEHCVCVCVCACGGDPPFSRTENYGECDDISVGVTGTKPHLLVGIDRFRRSLLRSRRKAISTTTHIHFSKG